MCLWTRTPSQQDVTTQVCDTAATVVGLKEYTVHFVLEKA